jgi:hypothetical protein
MQNELAHEYALSLMSHIGRLSNRDDDGCTLSFPNVPGCGHLDQCAYRSGYQVAVRGAELRIDREHLTPSLLRAWLRGPAFLTMTHNPYSLGAPHLGVWVTGGKVTLDVSYWVVTREQALRVGREELQDAIWDWANGASIPVEK